jgi:ABC-type lipoprotein export system ATPase subunit
MAKFIRDSIYFNTGRFEFDFKLNGSVTLILGDSSSGKTLFFNKLRAMEVGSSLGKYRFLNEYNNTDEVKALCKMYKDQIIVLDNADILIDLELRNLIHSDENNQYIIMGRYVNMYPVERNCIAFIREFNRRFELRYLSR